VNADTITEYNFMALHLSVKNIQSFAQVALQLADLSAEGVPVDADTIACGVLADAMHSGRLSMDVVQARLLWIAEIHQQDICILTRVRQWCAALCGLLTHSAPVRQAPTDQ